MSYRIFGMEVSPFSVKVRSYFRYKDIDHDWIVRSMSNMEEFQKFAKLPLVPLVITPENQGIQDSTPIIEKMEAKFTENSLGTGDDMMDFISALIEEYADEWTNKTMFHYRWIFPENIDSASLRIAEEQMDGNGDEEQIKGLQQMLADRMSGRLHVVGSSEKTRDQIESSFKRQLEILESHFREGRKYLFGQRPILADFGLFAQLYEHYTDPISKKIMDDIAPKTRDWCLRMLDPEQLGELEAWNDLKETLMPLLIEEVGALYLPWAKANSEAGLAGEDEFSVYLAGQEFSQRPSKYTIKSYGKIREKYDSLRKNTELKNILEESACLEFLS